MENNNTPKSNAEKTAEERRQDRINFDYSFVVTEPEMEEIIDQLLTRTEYDSQAV